MPKVLRIINRFNLGGPTYNVSYLSRYMAPEYETLLIGGAKDESEASSDHIVKSLDLHPVLIEDMRRSINPFNDIRAYRKIRKIIREFKPDIVHTHASKAGALGRLAAIHENVPVIVHTFHGHVFHSYFGRIKTGIFKVIERYLARKSSAIVAISEEQKKELSEVHRICEAGKITVIPLGFDLDRFRQDKQEKRSAFRKQWGIAEQEIVVSIIGRLVPVKNHHLFLDCVADLHKKHPEVKFLIVGDGELHDELRTYCDSLGVTWSETSKSATVIFTSWIRDVDTVLAATDIVALTSWNEGTPVSLIEAHAAGCPVVSTRAGSVADIVAHEKTGFICEPGEKNKFSRYLEILIESAELRAEMSEGAESRVISKYHYTRLVKDMKALYARLIE